MDKKGSAELKKHIEKKRTEMEMQIKNTGLRSQAALEKSQELDQLIYAYQKQHLR